MVEGSTSKKASAAGESSEIQLSEDMSGEELLKAAKKLKKQLSNARTKNEKLEQRFIEKVKLTKQH